MTDADSQTPDAPKPTEEADHSPNPDAQDQSPKPTVKADPKDETSPAETADDKPAEGTQKAAGTPTKVTPK